MLGFVQGFAYGLLVSCVPWLIAGLWNPRLALPDEPARRWQVLLRYWLVFPFLGILLWLTSLWGGFGPTLPGWLAGLAAIAVALPLERRWRRWRAARRAARADARATPVQDHESGLLILDPERPPADAEDVISGLCAVKDRLMALNRPDLASGVDRLYTRYRRVLSVLSTTFDPRELAYSRAKGLVMEVGRGGIDRFSRMAALVAGVSGVDAAYVRRRLTDGEAALAREERDALQQRLSLVEDTERQLKRLTVANEEALTVLDHAAVAFSGVVTERPEASVDAGHAMTELRRFAEGAGRYGRDVGAGNASGAREETSR